MTQIFMITETLFVESQAGCLCHINISDSALKVVLSYYPVCRCQRTSRFSHIQATKKLNFTPTINFVSENHAGTKLSPICSPQMYKNRLLIRGVPRLAGLLMRQAGPSSNRFFENFSVESRPCPSGETVKIDLRRIFSTESPSTPAFGWSCGR